MRKRVIKHIFLILWCLLIFFFSGEPGTSSSGRSGKITNTTIDVYEEVFDKNVEKRDEVSDILEFFIRKAAHFTLYFILGIIVFWCLEDYSLTLKKQFIYAVLFCFLYAISDEAHQFFTNGRDAKILDVLIDTAGGMTSTVIMYLFKFFKMKKIESRN